MFSFVKMLVFTRRKYVQISQQPVELTPVRFSNSKKFIKHIGNLRVIRRKK